MSRVMIITSSLLPLCWHSTSGVIIWASKFSFERGSPHFARKKKAESITGCPLYPLRGFSPLKRMVLVWNWSNSANCGRNFLSSTSVGGRGSFVGETVGRTLADLSPSCDGDFEWGDLLRRCFSRLEGEAGFPCLSLLCSASPGELPVDGLLLLSSWDFFGVLSFT